MAMQTQIQVLLAARGGEVIPRPNTKSNTEVAKPQVFDRSQGKILRFITACRLYIRMKIRGETVKEQIQQILSYVQRGLANIWKENILENFETGVLEYKTAGKFLADLKRKFGEEKEEEEIVKVAELRKLEQGGKMMKEFVQDFERTIRESKYKRWPLME